MASDPVYMRDYRLRTPAWREQQTKAERARRRALLELSRRHEMEYLEILAQQRKVEGLDAEP